MQTASQMPRHVCGDCLALTRRKREQARSWKAEGSGLGKYRSSVAAGNKSGRSWVNWRQQGTLVSSLEKQCPGEENAFQDASFYWKKCRNGSKQCTFGQGIPLRTFSLHERERIHSKMMPRNTSTDLKLSFKVVSSIVFHSSTLREIMKIYDGNRQMSEQHW